MENENDHEYMDVTLRISQTLSQVYPDDEESMISKYHGDIMLWNKNMTKQKKIGYLEASVIEIERSMNCDIPMVDVFDTSQELMDYYCYLVPKGRRNLYFPFSKAIYGLANEKDPSYNLNILVIHMLQILPRYRGKDYGLQAMHLALDHLGRGCFISVITPFPLQCNKEGNWEKRMELDLFPGEERIWTRKLKRHYARLGFVPIKGTPIMALDIGHGVTPWEKHVNSSVFAR